MDVKELKDWINKIPKTLDNNKVVFRTIKELDNDNWGALDISITACGIDEGNNEMYLCNEGSAKILDKG